MKVTQQNNGDGTHSVFIDGAEIISHESYTVASRIADALLHPEHEVNTEFGEVADNLRKVTERNRWLDMIGSRLVDQGALDLTDATFDRVFQNVAAPALCIQWAKRLRDARMLGGFVVARAHQHEFSLQADDTLLCYCGHRSCL